MEIGAALLKGAWASRLSSGGVASRTQLPWSRALEIAQLISQVWAEVWAEKLVET